MRFGKLPTVATAVAMGALLAASVQGQPARDTTLEMRAVTVKDQNQIRGRFGDAWTATEVRERAAILCTEAGMRLVYFQPGNSDVNGRTEFAAVCQ